MLKKLSEKLIENYDDGLISSRDVQLAIDNIISNIQTLVGNAEDNNLINIEREFLNLKQEFKKHIELKTHNKVIDVNQTYYHAQVVYANYLNKLLNKLNESEENFPLIDEFVKENYHSYDCPELVILLASAPGFVSHSMHFCDEQLPTSTKVHNIVTDDLTTLFFKEHFTNHDNFPIKEIIPQALCD